MMGTTMGVSNVLTAATFQVGSERQVIEGFSETMVMARIPTLWPDAAKGHYGDPT